jgi:hypothetical protein
LSKGLEEGYSPLAKIFRLDEEAMFTYAFKLGMKIAIETLTE